MAWKPSYPGEFPTLGWGVIEWIEDTLAMPDRVDYEPLLLYREQAEFILNMYRINPQTGKRVYNQALLGRPRGWGKSPFLAALCAVEALGPALFSHWDEDGQPVGKPWSSVRTPLIQIAAVSEQQTMNTWTPLLEMLRMGPATDIYPSLQVYDTAVILPRGRIEMVTASPRSIKGARAVFAVLDQSEEWVKSNGGIKLAETMRANAAKVGGCTVETPNAYTPGEGSVAEMSAEYASLIETGQARNESFLYDMREAPADTDIADYDSLIDGLRYAYGCSSKHPDGCVIHGCPPGHVDLDNLVELIWNPTQDTQQSRSDFLNQITHASDAWMPKQDWLACEDRGKEVELGETIVLGFDGSRGRARGNADATALIGIRVEDRHLFVIRIWEAKDGVRDWKPPAEEIDRTVRQAFKDYRVVGFYADPSGWQTQVSEWEAAFNRKLKVRATGREPIALWPRGKTSAVEQLTDNFYQAVVSREITHDGNPHLLRHVMNARRRKAQRGGYLLYKEFPESPNKIDGAYAAIMAFKACLDAQSKGIGTGKRRRGASVAFMK